MPVATLTRQGAPLLILVAAVLWSTGGLGIKWVKSDAGLAPLAITGWRSVASLLGLIILLGSGSLSVQPTPSRLGAAAAYAMTLLTLVSATTLTTAAGAILLQYTAPVWLTLMNFLLPGGDRLSKRDTAVCAFCMVALGLLIADVGAGGDRDGSLLGNLLGVASGIAFAVMTRLMRAESAHLSAEARSSSQTAALWAVLVGNAMLGVCCLPWMIEATPSLGSVHAGVLAGLGVFQIAVPYVLFTRAIMLISAVRATLIGMLEPILNSALVWALLGERPGPLGLLGGGILIATLVVDALWLRRAALTETDGPHARPAASAESSAPL